MLVDAFVLESEACEPESKITSGSIENMPDSSQPIEKNSILGFNVETICSDPLISGLVDDVSCRKSPARDGALVDSSVTASSIQMDSPLVSEATGDLLDSQMVASSLMPWFIKSVSVVTMLLYIRGL